MKRIVMIVLVLAAAAVVGGLSGRLFPEPKPKAAPWPPGVVGTTYVACGREGYDRAECDCIVREYERASPDPNAPGTPAERRAAWKACGLAPLKERPSQPEPEGDGI